ncbi:TraB/GumN family protein [Alteromonas facilis]|uniref:TraB/GumN family protein n=1 Tax=Alteromonas facilis TaxID=2048004 RepID=UPI000C293C39|nr:TraB/GumN family protein [Alteromonas facilis]
MRRCYLISLLLALSFNIQAASVWKVSHEGKSLYIGGTVHILSESDYPLPAEYKRAYDASEKLIFETDMAALQSMEFQQKTMAMMTYQDGRTFKDELSESVSQAVETHLTARGVPVQNLLTFKPSLLSITLSMIEFQVIGLTTQGVDKYYATLAMGDNKPTGWLETPDQQLNFLASLGKGQEDQLIQYTLEEIKTLKPSIDELLQQWRAGDMKALAASNVDEMKAQFPAVYHDLLVARNNNWLPQIEAMLSDDTTEFVLVGVLHLAGPDSVLHLLESKGYSVEKL